MIFNNGLEWFFDITINEKFHTQVGGLSNFTDLMKILNYELQNLTFNHGNTP